MAKSPNVSREQATSLATRYIESLDLRGWRYEVAEVKLVASDLENWTVVVDRFSPQGGLVDGPEILIVNGETGSVRTLESYYE